jgi:hypothetical protein
MNRKFSEQQPSPSLPTVARLGNGRTPLGRVISGKTSSTSHPQLYLHIAQNSTDQEKYSDGIMWRMLQGAFSVRGQELLELLCTAKGIRGARLAEVLKEDMWPIDQKTSESEVSITAFEAVFFARVELNSQELL